MTSSVMNTDLPSHYQLTPGQIAFSCLSIASAALLTGWLGYRVWSHAGLWHWWTPAAVLLGIAAADFGSGLIHWAADTWGRDDYPVIGRRLLVPFRIHHINPDDFLRRRFIDTNGEVAAVATPVLALLLTVQIDTAWGGPIALIGLAFCGIGSMTNQIHQWAHMPAPPAPVRVLQDCGLLLGRADHGVHHDRPYDRRYCITTGWCNRPLDAVDFFRRLESTITALTGVRPRHDDRRYLARYGVSIAGRETPGV